MVRDALSDSFGEENVTDAEPADGDEQEYICLMKVVLDEQSATCGLVREGSELRADGGNPKSLVGAVAGSSNPDDWRKANFVRAFTPQEALLSGSAWQLHFEGGSPFRVEFHADGHFNAPAYPAHSWYKLDGDAVFVEWGKYGQYEFVLDVAKREMNGHLRGNEKSWRRLEYTEPMAAYQKKHHCGHDH